MTLPLRPRGAGVAPQRKGFLRAAALVAAPCLAATLLSGLRSGGLGTPPAPLAATAETMVFVALPDGCMGLLRSPAVAPTGSRVARAAREMKPGGRPLLAGEEPPSDLDGEPKLRPGDETVEMQFDRVAKRTKWLNTLKGKFVPYGPKPWDKHRFVKACIQTRLDPKQAANKKIIMQVTEEIRRISGKHPYVVLAKSNIARLGLRAGFPCGVAVTIYGPMMYDFLHRLNTLILPRVRDFEGLAPNAMDRWGNFGMGFENQEPFKELDELVDSRELVHGFDINIVNNCMTQPDAIQLMKDFGFPFGDPKPPKPPKQPEWMYHANKKKAKKKR